MAARSSRSSSDTSWTLRPSTIATARVAVCHVFPVRWPIKDQIQRFESGILRRPRLVEQCKRRFIRSRRRKLPVRGTPRLGACEGLLVRLDADEAGRRLVDPVHVESAALIQSVRLGVVVTVNDADRAPLNPARTKMMSPAWAPREDTGRAKGHRQSSPRSHEPGGPPGLDASVYTA